MENFDKNKLHTVSEMKQLLAQEDFKNMWMKMHTPWIRKHAKIGRNEKCPCGSGKKYKNCSCYNERFKNEYELDIKHTKGWK